MKYMRRISAAIAERKVGMKNLMKTIYARNAQQKPRYDEMVDRVKDALSTPIDMAQMVKSILTKLKGELK